MPAASPSLSRSVLRRRVPSLLLLLAVASVFAATTASADDGAVENGTLKVLDLSAPLDLSGEWRLQPGDPPGNPSAWRDPAFDDSAWPLVTVPRGLGLQGHETVAGFFWYRLHLDVSALPTDPSRQLAIRLGQVDSSSEIFVDGVLVGSTGRVSTASTPTLVEHDRGAIVVVPSSALDDGHIVLAVRVERAAQRVSSNPGRGGITHGPLLIGDARSLARNAIVDDVDDVALGFIFFIVGLYHLQLWSKRRELRSYFWFGLFALELSVYLLLSRQISYLVVDSSLIRNKISFTAIFLAFASFIQFLWPFLGRPIRWWWRVVQGLALAFAVLTVLWPTIWFTQKYLWVFELFILLPEVTGLLVLLAVEARRGNPEARTILVGGIAIALTALNNMAVERNLYRAPELTNLAFLVFVLSMAVSLANRFARVYGTLDDKNAELIRQDKLKDEFLANTSHELRTPLNGILGLTEGLLDGDAATNPEVESDLRMIHTSGQRLSALINDILDFSKLREGKLELRLNDVDLRAIVDVVVRLLQPLATRKGLTIENAIDAGLPLVRGDEHRLQQILVNLVGNAIKFTEEGRIRVVARARENDVDIEVDDTGIGISPHDQERIFNAFEQADGSTARTFGGTGLGLSICRQLVDLHHGHLAVRSEVGRGSTFTVTLRRATIDEVESPLEARTPETLTSSSSSSSSSSSVSSSSSPPKEAAVVVRETRANDLPSTSANVPGLDGRRMTVLVVDDEPINVRVLEGHLKPLGFEILKAASGAEALEHLDRVKPDLVLLDVMMPRMSGYETCAQIRRRYAASDLPVVLVTAKDRVTDVVAGFDAGATDYLTKPVSKGELLARIRTHLRLAKVNEATNRFVPHEFLSMLGKESLMDVERGDQVQREMSILFSDIRAFTTIVEGHTPAENFRFINSYLAAMEPCIKAHHGFVDSFIGDAIMALFDGDGLGGLDAVNAGIGMHRVLPAYNRSRLEQGLVPVRIGIGVQTGPLTCGTMGGRHHIKCGVIGDAVNTASRIEGMTKMYGARFLIGEATRDALPAGHGITLRTVDLVTAKGKHLPTTIYEILDAEDEPMFERRHQQLGRFEEAMQRYRQRDFKGARELWRAIADVDADDFLTKLYLGRCEVFLAAPPPENWDGVMQLETK